MEILQHETQNDLTQALGNNLMYYGRRVCTKELAERVASITNEQIQKVAEKIVKNKDVLLFVIVYRTCMCVCGAMSRKCPLWLSEKVLVDMEMHLS